MKIGIAQINPVVGDFPGNAKRILRKVLKPEDWERTTVLMDQPRPNPRQSTDTSDNDQD